MAINPKSAQEAAEETLGAENVADFQAQLAALRAELAALAATLAAMSRTGSENVRQAAADAYADLKSDSETEFGKAAAEAEATLEQMADYARKNPLQSLGMAAGVGMLLGLLFGRR